MLLNKTTSIKRHFLIRALNLGFEKFTVGKIMIRLAVISLLVTMAMANGRLEEPPGRSTMWRFGFRNPVNYDDDNLNCGGKSRMFSRNGGKCGICGDSYDIPEPRPNEDGGKYGNGIIVREYRSDDVFTVRINLKSNHRGYFEFKICPTKRGVTPDQACFDKYPIALADGTGLRYRVPPGRKGPIEINLRMPYYIKCSRCILQWHYRAGNTWGICEDGVGRDGCGPQDTYRACADIQVT